MLVLARIIDQDADHKIKFAVIVRGILELQFGALTQIVRSPPADRRTTCAYPHRANIAEFSAGGSSRSETIQIPHLPQATHDRPLHRRAGLFADQSAQRLQPRSIVKLGQFAAPSSRRNSTSGEPYPSRSLLHHRRIAGDIPGQIQKDLRRLLPQARIL